MLCSSHRLATLDVLRMQWTAVMAKLQEDSKAMLQQRYEVTCLFIEYIF